MACKPFKRIPKEVEEGLRRQVADTIIVAVRTTGEPRFVTLGKKIDNNKLIVSFFGFAVQAMIDATTARTIRRPRDRSHAPGCFPPARL